MKRRKISVERFKDIISTVNNRVIEGVVIQQELTNMKDEYGEKINTTFTFFNNTTLLELSRYEVEIGTQDLLECLKELEENKIMIYFNGKIIENIDYLSDVINLSLRDTIRSLT